MQEYYERLKNVLESDIDLMLLDPEPKNRDPKKLLAYLDMLEKCHDKIATHQGSIDNELAKISKSTLDAIDELIRKDMEHQNDSD